MKRLLITLLSLWSVMTMAAMPPSTILNEQSTVGTGSTVTVLPNNQGTSLGGIKTRVETGNTNLLVNPSFEHPTLGFGWTKTSGVWVADTTYSLDGKKALQGSYSGGFDISQSSTTNAARLNGQQMVASVYMWSDDPTMQVCAIVNSVDTNCVTTSSTYGVYKQILIPFIGGGTSNGIKFKTTNTSMGEVHIDNAFVGLSNPLQNVNGARLIGSMTISGCTWSVSNTSALLTLGTTTGCTYTGTGLLTSPSTIINGFKLNQSLDAGTLMIVYKGANTLTSCAGSCSTQIAINDGSTTTSQILQYGYSANTSQTFNAVASGTFKFTYSSTIPSGTTYQLFQRNVEGGTFNAASPQTWEVYYYPPDSKIYSDNNAGFAENAGEVFAHTGSTCPTGTLAADGSAISRTTYADLFKAMGTVHGTGDGSTTFNLPDYRGRFLRGVNGASSNDPDSSSRTAMATGGNTGNNVGSVQADAFASHNHTIPSANAGGAGGNAGAVNAGGTINTAFNSQSAGGNETRPKNAYVNYCVRAYNRNITGSFAGLEKCANDYECTDTFSASIDGSGNVTGENIDWLPLTCALSGVSNYRKTCTFNSSIFTLAPSCTATATASDYIVTVTSTTSSTVQVDTATDAGGAVAGSVNIKCQKIGVDFKPKTAKVATSIGVPTVPGISTSGTGNSIDTFSVSFGATSSTACTAASTNCAYNDTIGTTGNYVFRTASAGQYTLFLSKTYAKLKCTGNAVGASTITLQPIYCTSSCNSASIVAQNSQTGASTDVYGTIYCQGSY